ncbi:ABC transporter substrate-binding protein [Streptacidiphilus cavernicola]|uniref:ABC transporter substrate-binding protein n=1 Tax=Streptacidiphilus cavernicola TaxID=3342716 RepID=A0ABV6VP08_9ACTN
MGSTRRIGRLSAAAAGAALLVAGLTGCGGNADASEGSTVTVMTWAPVNSAVGGQPGVTALAEAIGKLVNGTGGLAGRRLKVVTCNELNTAAGATACADLAVSDGVAAVVGSYSQYGEAFMPVLEAASIPYIGGFGITPEEFSSPMSYPVNGGYQALLAGNGEQLVQSGCRRVAVVSPKTDVGASMLNFLNVGLATGHIDAVQIAADPGGTDYTAEATQAIGADLPHSCVTTTLDPADTATFFDDYRRLGPRHTQLSSVIGSFQQSLVDSTGGDAGPLRDALATSWYPPDSSKVWDGLHDAVKKYAFTDNRINTADPGEQTTWIAYEVLRKAAAAIQGPVTASTLRSYLNFCDPITTGQTPPLAWRNVDMLALATAPRLVNTQVSFLQVRNGQLSQARSGPVDVRSLLVSTGGA